MGLGLLWLYIGILTPYRFLMFVGAAIAGVMSMKKCNSWINGVCAVVLLDVVFLVRMYF